MARRDREGPGGGVVDLGALGRAQETPMDLSGEQPAFYANDCQPSIETEGNVTLTFRYLGPDGASQPVRVAMPTGLFVQLMSMTPKIVEESVKRYYAQAQRLADYLRGVTETATAMRDSARPSATTTPIEQGRRDG